MTNSTRRKGKSLEQLGEELEIKNIQEKVSQLQHSTFLSPRESEIIVIKNESEVDSLRKLAKKMGISENSIYTHTSNVKNKLRRAETTLEEVNL